MALSLSQFFQLSGKGKWWCTSVYNPNRSSPRSLFWEQLSNVCGFCAPYWCMGGDFNAVRFPSDKLGGGRVTSSMRGFVAFIQDCGLGTRLFLMLSSLGLSIRGKRCHLA